MRRQQQGFTLIELVVVIVIIGLLSAFALPRFLSLAEDARIATIEGVAGSIKTASSLVHAACLVDSACSENESTANFDLENVRGDGIDLVNGYPAQSAAGILEAAQLEDSGDGVNGRLTFVNTGGGSPIEIQANDAANPANCSVTYSQPGAPGEEPDITVDTSDCS